MKIVTFNIRCDYGEDGENNFCFRKPLILEKLRREEPDVICFQEVLPHVAAWLKEALEGYCVAGCGRSETLEDEQMAVAYRKDRLNLIAMETFWLSETPWIPGSRYPRQSVCPRTGTEVLLEDLAAGQVFRLTNVHLDHEFPEARERALAQLLKRPENFRLFPHAPEIIAGDMNAEPDDPEMAALRTAPYQNIAVGMGATYHGFGRADRPCCIDYILTRGFVCERAEKWTDQRDGVYLSDHYPVCAVLRPADGKG
ncbi:MAG: endonuclease/exonuclease/phosphatase family protein [Oscillospiraceae bacterium]|nr:endonuclease/exonuclease/phosphatase family protein [Oscillospiraceae bacterium]